MFLIAGGDSIKLRSEDASQSKIFEYFALFASLRFKIKPQRSKERKGKD
jgi:hypothetical protein